MKGKLYVIQNTLSKKYYNQKDNYFTSVLYLGSYWTNYLQAEIELKKKNLIGCEIIEVSEESYLLSMADKTTELTIIGDVFSQKLTNINCILPTNSKVNKNLLNKSKDLIKQLKNTFGSQFKDFEESKEEITYDVLSVYETFVYQLSLIEMHEIGELSVIIEAYKRNPKEMIKKAKQINN